MLTYSKLRTSTYKQLIKSGYKDEQILSKMVKFYLKENRQIIINESKGLTLEKAVNDLTKGRVRQGVVIPRTGITKAKNNIQNLKTLSKSFGKNSFAEKVLNAYNRGEINVWELEKTMYAYTSNINEYESYSGGIDSVDEVVSFYD